MEEYIKNWEYDDFLYFCLIYAANADLEISPEEEDMIKKRAGAEKYNEISNLYKTNTDFDNFMILHEFKDRHLPNQEDIDKALNEIKQIFHADGEVSEGELNVEIAMKTILSN